MFLQKSYNFIEKNLLKIICYTNAITVEALQGCYCFCSVCGFPEFESNYQPCL